MPNEDEMIFLEEASFSINSLNILTSGFFLSALILVNHLLAIAVEVSLTKIPFLRIL